MLLPYDDPMKVLITGGAGFIGSHLADKYLSLGHSVRILDNFSTGSMENIKHISGDVEIVDGDIRDSSLIDTLVRNTDLVLHMAAALGVNTILDATMESISTNVIGSEVVLSASARHSKRIIIASTSEIYGKNPKQPLSENDDRVVGAPQKIRWSYSDAKAIEEAMAFSLHQEFGLPVTTIRLFNTVGPRQSGDYGMVVPRFVRCAEINEPLTVYGNGTQSRAFCHVYDTVRAIHGISVDDSTIANVFNIGNTNPISIADLALRVITLLKSKSEIEYLSYSEAYGVGFEDMQNRIPDISRIKKATGWEPELDLDRIILDVAKDFSQI
jgi:UDP-glucose 4-epimerase